MKHDQIPARNISLIEDAKTMTVKELCEKYHLCNGYIRNLLRRSGVEPFKKWRDYLERMRPLIPVSSFTELEAAFPHLSPQTIRSYVGRSGLRIGKRNNVRMTGQYAFRQLECLAALRDEPNATNTEISLRFHMTRERVCQIRSEGVRLGFLSQYATQPSSA